MVYDLLKLICRVALRIFYQKIDISGIKYIPAKGPLLIVANHPNTFMDPIVIASLCKQEVFFIAKSTVFNSPFRKWLLQKMNLIPVYRREDGPVNPEANNSTFLKCFEFLETAGTLLIFPEGNSFNQRRLRPLKTGAARIALGAAARHDFKQEITILPVGLNYSEPTLFRSKILVNIAPPIFASSYAGIFREDQGKAYKLMTEHLRVALEAQIIHTHTDEDDELLEQIEAVYKSKLLPGLGTGLPKPEEEFLLTRRMVASLAYFKKSNPEKVIQVKGKLKEYLQNLEQHKLTDKVLYNSSGKLHSGGWLVWAGLYLVIGFPVYLYGLLTNYIPYIIPARVANALTEEAEFIAPILMTTGIFTFPLFYTLEVYLFWYFTKNVFLVFCFVLSLPVAGFYVLHYYRYLKKVWATLKLKALYSQKRQMFNNIWQQRQELIAELDLAREQYLQQINEET